jgi:o-succinylbenzoate synthase
MGTETHRSVLLVEAIGPNAHGWGECVAEAEPTYSSEYTDGAIEVITRFLVPRLRGRRVASSELGSLFASIKGHPMAKGGIEAAVLDAECRRDGQSLAARLGATVDRVPSGVAVGMQESTGELLDAVARYVDEGYVRVKLKIAPGHDVDAVAAVRNAHPTLALQVDANGSYCVDDLEHLRQLDAFGLLLIEQPLADDDFDGHAFLGQHLATPICLDETITSARIAEHAIAVGACGVVNIKPGRVGGFHEAVRIHDVCVRTNTPAWCGGMLESGIGRAANLALAALPGFTLPGDLSASARYFHRDVTDAFTLDNGHLRVPTGPGIGVSPLADRLVDFTVATTTVDLDD